MEDDFVYSERPITAVLQARDRGDVESVIAALTDTNPEVRLIAADSLGRLRSASALEPLLRVARHSSDEMLRRAAIVAAGSVGGESAAETLVEIAGGDNPVSVRVAAISALVNLREERSKQLLAALVGSDDLTGTLPRPRYARSYLQWALRQLVKLRATETIPVIEQVLPRLGFVDRRHARRAIRRLRRP